MLIASLIATLLFGQARPPAKPAEPSSYKPDEVRITLEPSGQEVATTAAGGFFGEMSMLTGDPRTASVRAIVDSRVLEITSGAFSELALSTPSLLDHVTTIVSNRRVGLDEARAAAASVAPEAKASFLARMRKYLRV